MAYRSSVTAGQAGAVEGINEVYLGHNSRWTPDGYPHVINMQALPSYISGTSCTGLSTGDDTDAMQATFDWLEGNKARNHVVWFPFYNGSGGTARYMTSAPLRIWSFTHIRGPATIRPTASFDWVNHPYSAHPAYRPTGDSTPGNIALLELWRETGSGFRYSTCRIYIDSLDVDCLGQAGSIGAMFKLQQNAWTRDFRIDNAETGFVTWGQDGSHERMQIGGTSTKVGVFLGADFAGDGTFGDLDCKYMSFNKLNVEYYDEAAIRMQCDGPNWFRDSHFENQNGSPPVTARVIDCRSGQFITDNTNAQHSPPGSSVIVVGDKTPPPGIIWVNYSIRDWRNNNAEPTQVFMDDRIRNKTIMVGDQRMIQHLSGGFQNDNQADYDAFATWLGDEGGEVRIGGVKGGNSAPSGHSGAQFTVIPNAAQDEPMVRYTDSAQTLRAGVGQKGDLFLGSYTTATRPTSVPLYSVIIDTTLNKQIWQSAAGVWRDTMGTVV